VTALRDRTVLVTGAASGIGYECAHAFAKRGARLVVSDIDATGLEKVRAEIAGHGVACLARTCDVSSAASVVDFAAAVQGAVGPVDVLVNNAGIAFLGAFEETPVGQWRGIFDVNVLGIVHSIQAFLPAMRAAGGPRKIVNVASLAGFAPAPNMSAYAASKHAVVGLSEVLALELHDTEISVLVVCPGIIETNIVHASATAPGITAAQVEMLQQYYHEHGCHPRVVAADVVRAVEQDRAFLFTGPLARTGYTAMRVSRRLARRLTLRGARRRGYLV
jgi:NAD(P)-dependent dehydrogenase (short-subunit alcohol dehydrogenase family)